MKEKISRSDLIPGTDDSIKRRNVMIARFKVLRLFAELERDAKSRKVLEVFQKASKTWGENVDRIDETYNV